VCCSAGAVAVALNELITVAGRVCSCNASIFTELVVCCSAGAVAVALNELITPSCCRQSLFLGVNSVTRGLESASVGCVLIAQDADPKILVSHIPTMCGVQGVPVLIMSSLRSIVSTTLGFSCIALGVKVRRLLMWCVMAAPLGDTPKVADMVCHGCTIR
jgi:ribosomal protein L7Ae-like RNA K-turn-binding protein